MKVMLIAVALSLLVAGFHSFSNDFIVGLDDGKIHLIGGDDTACVGIGAGCIMTGDTVVAGVGSWDSTIDK